MSYKVYKSQNYFVVHDTATSIDVIRQVRDLVRWEKKGTLYSFYYNTPNLTTSGNAIIRLGYVYEFSDLVDSSGTAWGSQAALDLYLEQWTGHICCPTTGEDALYNLYNSVPTLLSTGAIPSGESADISAPDGTINVNKTGGGLISSQSVPSGATVNYSVADNAITVNSTNGFSIDATDPLDIVLTDGTSSVTPVSVTPNAGLNKVDIVLPAPTTPSPRSTATLLKSGQTVSYRTGDDGDLEAGRATAFLTLDTAPLHNNGAATINTTTNRFTDTLGGQTYTNNIVLDWSTWNGSTILGLSRAAIATGNTWNQAIDNSLAFSVGTFTSGWRLPNIREIFNLTNYVNDQNNLLNYSPLNLSSSGRIYWSSTTIIGVTTAAYGFSNVGFTSQQSKTSSVAFTYFPVRTFSLSTSNTLT